MDSTLVGNARRLIELLISQKNELRTMLVLILARLKEGDHAYNFVIQADIERAEKLLDETNEKKEYINP